MVNARSDRATEFIDDLQMVTFDLGNSRFGVDIRKVREIIRPQQVREIPESPDAVKGVVNLRGVIIPIIDLHARFRLPETDETNATRIVVVDVDDRNVGFQVDAVDRVLQIAAAAVDRPPAEATSRSSTYIGGFARIEDELVTVLDLDELLTDEALVSFHGGERRQPEAEPASASGGGGTSEDAPALDVETLEQTFATLAPAGMDLVTFFYNTLLEEHPHLEPLFEDTDMGEQRKMLLSALGAVIANLRRPDVLLPHLQQLGRKHVDYGVNAEDYDAVGGALLKSLAHFAGELWTSEVEGAWAGAYTVVASVMREAAAQEPVAAAA